tara:strand:+ start:5064 stop:7586 length:2523 start_codon:yes stop_codon:yes gene_type:complete
MLLFLLLCRMAGVAEESPHWSYQPLTSPDLPQVEDRVWVKNEIDRFILANMERNDVKPVESADREALIRRASLALIGLPPTIEEIDAFLADDSPDAYERLVDRLLVSPHYGERWGRHWLDVARYIQGTIKVDGVDQIDLAAPYRDYVVRAFNQDKPYDRFLTEQVAGDLLPESENETAKLDQKVAPAFLAIGPWFDECTDPNKLRLDIIDEQISTLTKAVLGLDFACARCHDHKFDPIPTRDYYALAGIFRSTRITSRFSEEWRDGRPRLIQPLVDDLGSSEARILSQKLEERWRILSREREQLVSRVSQRESEYQAALHSLPQLITAKFEAEDYAGQRNLRGYPDENGPTIGTRKRQDQWAKYYVDVPEAGSYALQVRYAADEPVSTNVEINGKLKGEAAITAATGGWDEAHQGWVSAGSYTLHRGRNLIRLLAQRHEWFPRLDRLKLIRVNELEPERGEALSLDPKILEFRRSHPEAWPPSVAETEWLISPSSQLEKLDREIQELREQLRNRPVALKVAEDQPQDVPIHIGGQVYQTEEELVPRGVPTLGKLGTPQVPTSASGRKQLAEWLTNPANPLPARVFVNRVWHWHFGRGIVATTSEFGELGAEPSHPELLEWLASEFIANGWSIKELHRKIMTSATYRLSSETEERNALIDPDSQLHWRFPRYRLEAEAIYDSMLVAAGVLPIQESGEPLHPDLSKDRALYILTSGRSPLGLGLEIRKMFPLFGFDESGVPMSERSQSETPAQALFWLNNPLPKHYADQFADRLLAMKERDEPERIAAAFRIALGKRPQAGTIAKTQAYLAHLRSNEKLSERDAWSRVCLGIFSSESFRFQE